jgi:putative transposase
VQYPQRKPIRLPLERYSDPGSIWHVSIVTAQRLPVFERSALAADVISSLKTTCINGKARLLVYCLMPDHLHAVIQVEEADLISILRNFKSFTTRTWWSHGGSGALWQRSAYDRGHREHGSMDSLLAYVFDNPESDPSPGVLIDRGLLGGELIDEQ